MEPILTIDNLNSFGGNMLRQGDKSQLKYRLRDVGNKNLSISGKSCEIKMYGRNYTTVVYETTTTVSSDNTVSFTIDKVLPKGTFYLEFTVGDYIFPTDHREFFEITPSGKGIESNVIEIVGKDVLIREVKRQVDADLSGVVDKFNTDTANLMSELSNTYDDLLENGVLQTSINDKLADLETQYSPKLTEVTAQLAQAESDFKTKPFSRSNTSETKRPMVTFYLDDGYQADYDVVLPKASSLGFPLTISVYNGSPLTNTPERLDELVNTHGWELHGHSTDGHSFKGLSYNEQYNRMLQNNIYYKNLGYDLKGICYPIGETDDNTLRAARKLYDVGMGSDYGINNRPIDTYHVKRLITDVNVPDRKAQVDKILADGQGWIVLYSHAGQFEADPFKKDNFFEMMDYVKSKGIDVVTVGDALKVYGNTLDIGDKADSDYVKIGADGLAEFTSIPFVKDRNNVSINERLGTDFKPGFVSINNFGQGNPSDIPFDSGIGTLYTDRTYEGRAVKGSLAFQKFDGYRGRIVTRYYITGAGWSVWSDVGILNKSVSNVDGNSLVSDFPLGKISTNDFIAGEGSGLLGNGAGTLITDRTGKTSALHYQIFVPNNNKVYKRVWKGASDWSNWYQYSPVRAGILPGTYFGSLSAGASSTKEYIVDGLEVGDVVNLNLTVPQEGFIYTCSVTAKDTLSVTVYNVGTDVINVTTTFRYSVVSQ